MSLKSPILSSAKNSYGRCSKNCCRRRSGGLCVRARHSKSIQPRRTLVWRQTQILNSSLKTELKLPIKSKLKSSLSRGSHQFKIKALQLYRQWTKLSSYLSKTNQVKHARISSMSRLRGIWTLLAHISPSLQSDKTSLRTTQACLRLEISNPATMTDAQ